MKKQTRLILVKMHKNIGRLLEIYQNWVIDSYDLDVLANRNGKVTILVKKCGSGKKCKKILS